MSQSEEDLDDIWGYIDPMKLTEEDRAKNYIWRLLGREFHEFR